MDNAVTVVIANTVVALMFMLKQSVCAHIRFLRFHLVLEARCCREHALRKNRRYLRSKGRVVSSRLLNKLENSHFGYGPEGIKVAVRRS